MLNQADDASRRRLATCVEILAIDPTLRGLGAHEKHRRSLVLIEKTLVVLERRFQENPEVPVPVSVREKIERARTLLSQHQRPPSYSDATEVNTSLAEELWAAHGGLCKTPLSKDDPLSLVFAILSR